MFYVFWLGVAVLLATLSYKEWQEPEPTFLHYPVVLIGIAGAGYALSVLLRQLF